MRAAHFGTYFYVLYTDIIFECLESVQDCWIWWLVEKKRWLCGLITENSENSRNCFLEISRNLSIISNCWLNLFCSSGFCLQKRYHQQFDTIDRIEDISKKVINQSSIVNYLQSSQTCPTFLMEINWKNYY